MRKVFFENRSILKTENITEITGAAVKGKNAFLLLIISALCVVFGIYYITLYNRVGAAVFLITAAFGIGLYFGLPYIKISGVLKAENDEETETSLYFYANCVKGYRDDGREIKVKYSEISRVIQTESLILMFIPRKMVITIDKNGFTKGEPDDFEWFIFKKAVNARVDI